MDSKMNNSVKGSPRNSVSKSQEQNPESPKLITHKLTTSKEVFNAILDTGSLGGYTVDKIHCLLREMCQDKLIDHAVVTNEPKSNLVSVTVTLADKSTINLELAIHDDGSLEWMNPSLARIGEDSSSEDEELSPGRERMNARSYNEHEVTALHQALGVESQPTALAIIQSNDPGHVEMIKKLIPLLQVTQGHFPIASKDALIQDLQKVPSQLFSLTEAQIFKGCLFSFGKCKTQKELVITLGRFLYPNGRDGLDVFKAHYGNAGKAYPKIITSVLIYAYAKIYKNELATQQINTATLKESFKGFIQKVLDDTSPLQLKEIVAELKNIEFKFEPDAVILRAPFVAHIDFDEQSAPKALVYSPQDFKLKREFKQDVALEGVGLSVFKVKEATHFASVTATKAGELVVKIEVEVENSKVKQLISSYTIQLNEVVTFDNKFFTVVNEAGKLKILEVAPHGAVKIAYGKSYCYSLALADQQDQPEPIYIYNSDTEDEISLIKVDGKYVATHPNTQIEAHKILPLPVIQTKTGRGCYVLHQDKLYCIAKNKQLLAELFPNFHLSQGNLGDCYLLASLFTFISNPLTAAVMLNSFNKIDDKHLSFNFPVRPALFAKLTTAIEDYKNANPNVAPYLTLEPNGVTNQLKFHFDLDAFSRKTRTGHELSPDSDLGFRILEVVFGFIITVQREQSVLAKHLTIPKADQNLSRPTLKYADAGSTIDVVGFLDTDSGSIMALADARSNPELKSDNLSWKSKTPKTGIDKLLEPDHLSASLSDTFKLNPEQAKILAFTFIEAASVNQGKEGSTHKINAEILKAKLKNSNFSAVLQVIREQIKTLSNDSINFDGGLRYDLSAVKNDPRPALYGKHRYSVVPLKDEHGQTRILKFYNPHNTSRATYDFDLDNDLDLATLISLGFDKEEVDYRGTPVLIQ